MNRRHRYLPCSQDVAQTVMLQLAVKLRRFTYQPGGSFRGWLRKVTRHAWSEFVADQQRAARTLGDETDILSSVEAYADLETRLADAFDLELLEAAADRVRGRVEPHTWDCFRLTTEGGPLWRGGRRPTRPAGRDRLQSEEQRTKMAARGGPAPGNPGAGMAP